jgi:2-polyprenyl-3-methyl-5-hydroxy-6-metoxy-1,4-benzoquinol methylase
MPLGPFVRSHLGRHERRVAELYRSLFVDVDDFARKIHNWMPCPRRILEVGCGEGAVTERLAKSFPEAQILAIDITPRAGRMYRGRSHGVEFRCATVQEIAESLPAQFDLIVLADVLHHVPGGLRPDVIAAIERTLAPDGRFILKDWGRTAQPIHWLCHASDRWLTGDRVAYLTPPEAKRLVGAAAPRLQVVAEGDVKPWRSNYALVFAC